MVYSRHERSARIAVRAGTRIGKRRLEKMLAGSEVSHVFGGDCAYNPAQVFIALPVTWTGKENTGFMRDDALCASSNLIDAPYKNFIFKQSSRFTR